jgi:hypothetical protein
MAFTNVMSWPGARLYDYMDGAAETYFARNFRDLGTAETSWRKTDARIELYLLKTPADAKGLFDDQNDGKGKQLPAGAGSAAWDAKELEGIFHRGPYFCRVIIYGNSAAARQLLDALSAAIDQKVPRQAQNE